MKIAVINYSFLLCYLSLVSHHLKLQMFNHIHSFPGWVGSLRLAIP
jgi:hypothetical protein